MANRSVCLSFTEEELEYFGSINAIKNRTMWALVQSEVNKAFENINDVPSEVPEQVSKVRKNMKVDFPNLPWRKIVYVSGKMNLTPTQFVSRLIHASHFMDIMKATLAKQK